MLLPIGVSVHALLKASAGDSFGARELGAALVLAIAYGANIGGMGTLIGTPPNAILKAYMETSHGIQVGFAQWMLLGVPIIMISVPLVQLILTRLCFRVGRDDIPGIRDQLAGQRASLGRVIWPEWAVAGA